MQISIHDHTLIVIHALLGIASLTHAAPQENQHVDVDPQYNTFLTLTDFETANELKPASRERAILARAVQTYHEKTCIRFVPRNARKHTDYLVIGKIDGCFSDVGRAGGRQELSLDIGCIEYDTAIHELMHAVGFWHEHERWDRDRFIYINWPNIETDAYDQFGKVNLYESDYYSENYDYLSIMHYDSKSFTRNGRNTMEARKQEYTYLIGRVKDFSSVDLRKIRKMYNCDEKQYSALKATKPKIERRKIPNPVKSTVAHPPPKLEAFRIHSTRTRNGNMELAHECVSASFGLVQRQSDVVLEMGESVSDGPIQRHHAGILRQLLWLLHMTSLKQFKFKPESQFTLREKKPDLYLA